MNTYCINLKQRKSKWNKVQPECEKLNLNVTRFEAIFNKSGHDGCYQSHIALLKQIEDDVFMIIEDDIKVLDEDVMDKAVEQLPSDWDMLYLGAALSKKIDRYSDNLFRLKGAKVTHAIMYNNQNGVVDFIIKNARPIIDEYYCNVIQERFNCFITYPMVCSQADGFSDTIRWWKDYDDMERAYKKYAI